MTQTLLSTAKDTLAGLEQLRISALNNDWHTFDALLEDMQRSLSKAVNSFSSEEPNFRHPKVQSLIGQAARLRIELSIIDDLLEKGPQHEPTCSDMEYWHSTHDKIVELREFKDRLIDALVVSHIYRKEHETDPIKAINDLVCWEADLALDPAVSTRALYPPHAIKALMHLLIVHEGRDPALAEQMARGLLLSASEGIAKEAAAA
jgi:hypothetical protein